MAIDFLSDVDTFSQEDNAEFGVGNSDMVGYWYSMQPTAAGETISGLCFPAGRKDFDEAMERVNTLRIQRGKPAIQCVPVIHDSSNQYGNRNRVTSESNEKEYWCFPDADLFIVARGLKEPYADQGIVYAWTYVENRKTTYVNGKPKPNMSSLRFRVFITELLEAGYQEPVQISSSSSKAGAFLRFLKTQQRVIAEFKALTGKRDAAIPFWAFSLPLGKSKVTPVGSAVTKNMILPECKAPEKITEQYLNAHYVTKSALGNELKEMIKALLDETVAWAKETHQNITKDKEPAAEAGSAPDESVPADLPSSPDYYEEVEPSPSPVASKGAAQEGQRKALKTLATRKGRPDLATLATKPTLTFSEAAQAIKDAQGSN